jgi:hypothetical protein
MIEHHLHRVTRPAHATGGHQHHRATLSDGSVKVSFWRCASGTAPLHACPEEPDPLARLIVKVAEARAAAARRRYKCQHPTEYRSTNAQGYSICLECRREATRRSRERKRTTTSVLPPSMVGTTSGA